jgi:hypothetical protein
MIVIKLATEDHARVMHKLIEYYVEQVDAINGAINEQFEERGVTTGEVFPLEHARELMNELKAYQTESWD